MGMLAIVVNTTNLLLLKKKTIVNIDNILNFIMQSDITYNLIYA